MEQSQEVTELLNNAKLWRNELSYLRKLVFSCGMVETVKWRQPCYMVGNQNVLIISGFKNYCALNFFKGSLLKDELNLLVKAGENTQGARQMRFTDLDSIRLKEAEIKAYIFEAVELEKSGIKIDPSKRKEIEYPEELKAQFRQDKELEDTFSQLTPGRQRAYLMYFSEAKQSATRTNRIQKVKSRILKGKGMNDCICGLSKRMPNCDGSHKQLEE